MSFCLYSNQPCLSVCTLKINDNTEPITTNEQLTYSTWSGQLDRLGCYDLLCVSKPNSYCLWSTAGMHLFPFREHVSAVCLFRECLCAMCFSSESVCVLCVEECFLDNTVVLPSCVLCVWITHQLSFGSHHAGVSPDALRAL